MTKIINGIIVVEGITDVSFLSQFIDAEFVTTNGSEIPLETIEYLKNSQEKRDIFVLTDPDSPGKKIRDTLYIIKVVIKELTNTQICPSEIFSSWKERRTKFVNLTPKNK